MTERNYWTRIRRQRLSRRSLLRASARAGVGAAGIALVGCGSDDDQQQQAQPAPAASAAAQQQEQQQEQPAAQQQAQQEQAAEQQAQQAAQQEEQQSAGETTRLDSDEDQTAAEPEVDLDATLNVAINRQGGGFDPQRSGSQTNYMNASAVFEAGMSNHPDTAALEANLVSRIEIIDPTNLNFHVAQGVFFHDGSEYTAADMQFNFERVAGEAAYHEGGATTDYPGGAWASARGTFGTKNFASHSVPETYIYKVETPKPNASLAGSIMSGAVRHMSKAYVEANGDAHVDGTPMGTGPFLFAGGEDEVDMQFQRFGDYHRPRDGLAGPRLPWVAGLNVQVRPEAAARVAAIQAGEMDIAFELPPDVVQGFEDDERLKILYGPAGQPTHHIMPNTHLAEWDGAPNPFLDIRVREAANLAINRDAIINGLLTGNEKPSYGPYSGTIGYPKTALESRYHGYDPERAKQLLADAGYPDGFDTKLHVVTDFQTIVPVLALVAQQDLEAVGIRTQIVEYLTSEYFVETRKFEQPGLWWFFTNTIAEPETVNGSEINEEGFYAVSVYPDTEIQELYLAQNEAIDPAERADLLEQFYTLFYDNHSWIFLTEVYSASVTAANINWPAGAAEIRNAGSITNIQKLRV